MGARTATTWGQSWAACMDVRFAWLLRAGARAVRTARRAPRAREAARRAERGRRAHALLGSLKPSRYCVLSGK